MSQQPKILFVLHGWPSSESGGTGHVVQTLAETMLTLNYQVAVAAPENRIKQSPNASSVEIYPIRVPNPSEWRHTWDHPAVDTQFAQLLRDWTPDIVHIHHLSGLSFGMVTIAKAAGVKVVLTLHDYAIPCARGQLVNEQNQICGGPEPVACGQCLKSISPIGPGRQRLKSLTRHFPRFAQRVHRRLSGFPLLHRNIQTVAQLRINAVRDLFQQVDSLDAPSMDLCNRIAAMGYPQPKHSPLPLVHPIRPAPEPLPGPVRFLFIGSLIPTKGPDRLVQAFQQLALGSASLTLVGEDTPYFGRTHIGDFLKEAAKSNPQIRLVSTVQSQDMSELLANHDVLVLPSTWPENSPLVIREATAAGLRTIVGREGGARELDPTAAQIGPTGIEELVDALRAECRIGRSRRTIRQWPTPEAVVHWHIVNSYGGIAD